ncbi:Yip1 family protein [Lysinibacillus xylanilyticus]|uniref:Yip1 family protein n=1 Tax=Lysinibacillus xylanilyticus TaxID=582475 RepID=A0ABV3W0T8_9BACI
MEDYNDTPQARTKLNPFLSAWIHPKQTARYMIDEKSIGFAILIMSIGYIGSSLSGLIEPEFSDFSPWLMALLCVIFAPIAGIIGTCLSTLIFWLFGKIFKGTGTFSDLFKGLSLTAIPYIVLIPLYLIWLITSPETLMNTSSSETIPWLLLITGFVSFVLAIWSLVITVGVVAEAHQFEIWKAILTVIIPSITLFIIFFVFFIILMFGIIGFSMM